MSRLLPSLALSDLDAVIVDLDGTMVDTLGDFEVALNGMLREMALPAITRAQIRNMVGKGSEHLIRSVLQRVRGGRAPDEALAREAWERYSRHYLAVNGQHSTVYPGVAQGLAALRAAGLRLACLTNKPGAFAGPLLASKGLARHFDLVFGGDAFERKKPDPLPLVKTCEALGFMRGRTLMVGDSSNDAQAARAAGCPVVLMSYGYNHGESIDEVDADGWLDSLADLPPALLAGT
ncbi:phosphoglycolate phosphatase [Variovorax sp.]|uniref:phosphoglycolate phosphatase n=1 Tax=Variovorax sp. TaxID=1871043 RepID=UPI002D433714|nr:phosphoglycolate phosphatase [Variovorax sp.]HYP84252.1 phosphoglycolate phosphatase [Variovorax sp.]